MHNSSDDVEVIREQMEETRNSLTEKLEALEQQVTETASGAAAAVTDSVQSVKEAVQDTVETVKETVQETVETVKTTFDVEHQMRERPWLMLLGATVVGYVGGRLVQRASENRRPEPPVRPMLSERPVVIERVSNGPNAGPSTAPAQPGLFAKAMVRYSEEIAKLEGLALATVCGLVRDNLAASVNPDFGERLSEVIDGLTEKMGGKPIRGPVLPTSSRGQQPKEPIAADPVAAERMKRRFGTIP